jgi:hypothetical protein
MILSSFKLLCKVTVKWIEVNKLIPHFPHNRNNIQDDSFGGGFEIVIINHAII